MPHRIRILIAEDHTLVAELFKELLENEFEVAGIVGDGCAMVRAAVELRPDLILADIAMPLLSGLDAGEQVKEICPAIKLVYVTMNADAEVAAEAFRRGASGYLVKTCPASELVIAIREVLRGNTYISGALYKERIDYLRRRDREMVAEAVRVTPRQREVLRLLAEGKRMKEVGAVLGITVRTVAFHKYRVMEMLGVKSNAELVRYLIRNRIVSGENSVNRLSA